MMINRLGILLCLLLLMDLAFAQELPQQGGDSVSIMSPHLVSTYIQLTGTKAGDIEKKLDKQTTKLLERWRKQERKIQSKLERKDSVKATALLSNSQQQYEQLEQKLQAKTSLQQYIPSLDTAGTSLKFLQQNPLLLANAKNLKEKLSSALSKVKGVEGQFQKAEVVKSFLKQREQYLKEQLTQLGFAKELKKLNKQAYYYSAQVNEYKSLLKDHRKAEQKALQLLSKTKLFNNFMRKNSVLASLFRMPADPDDPVSAASLAGLQTRAQVNGLIQQTIAAGGPNAQQQLQQNIQAAQSQINELKNKVAKLGNSGSDAEMPEGFKPNNQKTKSFFNRLELGTNIQSQKANGFFPTTSDIGLSLGYKLNDNSIIGLGGSYKMGWGQNIRHINITHQGAGVRSFVDYKIKGSFWLSGGYEMNYRSEFKNIEELKMLSSWQQSGLVGMSKVVSLKTKFFKKTKLQLLWDFLSYRQVPATQAILFRINYNFK